MADKKDLEGLLYYNLDIGYAKATSHSSSNREVSFLFKRSDGGGYRFAPGYAPDITKAAYLIIRSARIDEDAKGVNVKYALNANPTRDVFTDEEKLKFREMLEEYNIKYHNRPNDVPLVLVYSE